jgi:secreted trypsin-like serine protease
MRKLVLGLLAAAIAATAAQAITYGQADGTRHPMVGALVGTFDGQTYPYCSGTLIAPTVFLTAAHCDIGSSSVTVTFDEVYTAGATLHAGTYHANPAYTKSQKDPQDLAVVVFPAPIAGITPAHLPAAGVLDTMRANGTLGQGTRFTSVGYGAQEMPKGKLAPTYEDAREFASSSFNALGPGYLRLSQNQATGDGGTCYGDSGGPNFFGAGAGETTTIAATTITGDTRCAATNVTQRLDTPAARAFLGNFVTLP